MVDEREVGVNLNVKMENKGKSYTKCCLNQNSFSAPCHQAPQDCESLLEGLTPFPEV